LLEHYLLFGPPPALVMPPDAEARLVLLLATDYLIRGGATGGFSVDEAAQAQKVTILGDAVARSAGHSMPASVEGKLRAAGCEVTCLAGDGFALAEILERQLPGTGRQAAAVEEG
jgi:hypothetical protein